MDPLGLKPGRRATRQDVAAAAGVSGATVSRVYNHAEQVDSATVEKVRAAAAALGFVPDKNAAALRRQSSGTLLFVELEGDQGYQWSSQKAYGSLYGEIVRSVLHAVQDSSLSLQLVSLRGPREIGTLDRFGDFAGILGFDITDQAVADALAAWGRPVVCAHHGDHLTGVSTVSTDNLRGGQLQAEWLRGLGHDRVCYVTGMRTEVRSHRLRWEGFRSALEPVTVLDGALGYTEGQDAGRLGSAQVRAGRVSAFACVNDLTALGVIQGLAAEGLEVPRDAVVVGYDNLVLAGLLGRGLPTVEARLPVVYTRALELLARRLGGGSDTHELVEPEFIGG